MKPWKFTDQDPGECNVADRATGRTVGYLRQNFHGNWSAFLTIAPGWALPFGWRALTPFERQVYGGAKRRPILTTKYQADAAARVWQAWTAGR